MILKRLEIHVNNELKSNCYIVIDEFSKEGMIVDPGGEPEKIIKMAKILEIKLKYIVLTHCHADHIAAAPEIKAILGGKILIHTLEKASLSKPDETLFDNLGLPNKVVEVDARLNDGDVLHLGDVEFKVIHTPGHTKGGICLYCPSEEFLISGDTLFSGTWGRTDLLSSNFQDIITSISNKLMILPEDTIVYPGHGKPTMIKEEERVYLNLLPKQY